MNAASAAGGAAGGTSARGGAGAPGQCALTGPAVAARDQFNSCGSGNHGVQIFCNNGSFTCGADLGRSAVDAKNDDPVQKGVAGGETIAVAADNADPGRNGVAGGETADDNFGAPKSTAAGLPPLHIGDRGIPLIGHNVFPLEAKDNTIKRAEAIHSQAFVFDPDRKGLWDASAPPHPDTYKQTVKNIERLRQEAQEQGKRITELHVYGEFEKLQLRTDGASVNNPDRVEKFIKSEGMKAAFRQHPLLPFGLIFSLFHRDTSSTLIYDSWFPAAVLEWTRNHPKTPLDFEPFVMLPESKGKAKKSKPQAVTSQPKTTTSAVRVTNSLLAVAKAASSKCFNHLEDYQDAAFGMHLGLRKINTKDCKERYYEPIRINLGRLNPKNIATYLFVVKTEYPLLAALGREPTLYDLYNDSNISVSPCALPAFQLALTAANEGMNEEKAVEILRLMYKLGGRTPLIPPPKEIDARAKASAVGEVKNAVKESAGGCHRIALPNKKGPGWDVDGLDGEIQAASAEVHSLLKHPNAYQHQGDHQGGFTCDVNEAAMRYLATTGMGDPAPPLKTPQGSFVGQDETIGNVNEAAMRDLATTGMGNPAAPVKSPQHSRAGKDETIGDGFSPIENYRLSAADTSPNNDLLALLQVNLFLEICHRLSLSHTYTILPSLP